MPDTDQSTPTTEPQRGLFSLFVDRPVLTLMVVVTIVLVGAISLNRLPLRLMPEGMTQNEINVHVPIRLNRSPQEVREEVVEPLEELLRTIPGLKRVRTEANSSRAFFRITLEDSLDPTLAAAEVRDRVQRARLQWPDDVDRYFSWTEDGSSVPLAMFQILTPSRDAEWDAKLDEIVRPRLESIDGVGRVDIWGLMDDSIRIWFDRELIEAHRLEFRELLRKLGADNFAAPVGELDNGRRQYLVRVDMKFRSLSDIEEFPVGEGLRLKDIARVERVPTVRDDLSRYDQSYTYMGFVSPSADANPVDAGHRLQLATEELGTDPRLPGLSFRIMFDQGEFIAGSLDTLRSTALLGGVLALLVLMVFLRNLRMTGVIALAIPLTLLVVGGYLFFSGASLNLCTMAGMTLAVGMVVDNSVVVLENIRRLRERGVPLRQACVRGSREVALPVSMATMTTVVVFLPMGFMAEGNMARASLSGVGIPLSMALVTSLFVALLLLPSGVRALGSGAGGETMRSGHSKWSPLSWLLAFNRTLLGHGLQHRVLATLAGIAVLSTVAIPFNNLELAGGGGDMGPGRRGEVGINMDFPRGLTLDDAEAEVNKYEEFVLARKEQWQVKGVGSRFSRTGGRVDVFLHDGIDSEETERLRAEIMAAWPRSPGIEVTLQQRGGAMQGGGGAEEADNRNFVVRLWGRDSDYLMRLAEDVRDRLERLAEVETVEVPALEREQEVIVQVDRDRIQDLGVPPDVILSSMTSGLQGRELTRFEEDGREVRLVAQYDAEQEPTLMDLKDTQVWSQGGFFQRLDDVSDISFERSMGNITSLDGRTNVVLVGTRTLGVGPRELTTRLENVMDRFTLPRGYSWTEDSVSREAEAEVLALFQSMLLSITLVFLLMGVLFESVILPISILVTIPFALFGAFWTLYLVQGSIDALAIIGMMILCGVVVNNGIVLLDFIERLRRQGMSRAEAILEGTRVRIRPIVMTASTTIFGLLPMAILGDTESGAISYVGLAIAVTGGIAFSTIFTAFAVPMAYTFADDLSAWLRGLVPKSGPQTTGQKGPPLEA